MPARQLQKFGPDPAACGIGAEAVHAQIHAIAVGKTITQVYLGDSKPIRSLQSEGAAADGMFRNEYLILVFSDGSKLSLEIGSGNSFFVALGDLGEKLFKHATT